MKGSGKKMMKPKGGSGCGKGRCDGKMTKTNLPSGAWAATPPPGGGYYGSTIRKK